jgi:hypothetical protein
LATYNNTQRNSSYLHNASVVYLWLEKGSTTTNMTTIQQNSTGVYDYEIRNLVNGQYWANWMALNYYGGAYYYSNDRKAFYVPSEETSPYYLNYTVSCGTPSCRANDTALFNLYSFNSIEKNTTYLVDMYQDPVLTVNLSNGSGYNIPITHDYVGAYSGQYTLPARRGVQKFTWMLGNTTLENHIFAVI